MKGLSRRRLQIEYGFNSRHLQKLIDAGILCEAVLGQRRFVTPESIARLQENVHFVVCHACGARQALLSPKHLKSCSNLDIAGYSTLYPGSNTMCSFTRQNKAKTEEQKRAQSKRLRDRFTTPEGQITRAQIAAAARITANAQKDIRAKRLQILWENPEHRAKQTALTKERWDSGLLREVVVRWHRENKTLSNQLIANARKYSDPVGNLRRVRLTRTNTSKLHLAFKARMVSAGLDSFTTESLLGPFHVDEARSDLKLALEIDGCWWHGCQSCGFTGVRSTISNDRAKNAYLAKIGWVVVRVRECEIKRDPDACVSRIWDIVNIRSKEIAL